MLVCSDVDADRAQYPYMLLARTVIREALDDWQRANRGRVTHRQIGICWRVPTEAEHQSTIDELLAELRNWFESAEPHGMAWWCDMAALDVDAVREEATRRAKG